MFTATKTQIAQILRPLGVLATEANPGIQVFGTEFDSRRIAGAPLFVALQGAQTSGEKFVSDACSRGAPLALVQDKSFLESDLQHRCLVVSDTKAAWHALARFWRQQLTAHIFGIAGSVGKTSTKNLLAHLLKTIASGHAAEKSFNNDIGVPYTVLQISKDAAWAVLELGMNHPGELSVLSRLCEPHTAIITRVAPEHMEFFSDLDAVAQAESEVLDGLQTGGTIVYPTDDLMAARAIANHPRYGEFREVRFGTTSQDTVAIVLDSPPDIDGCRGVIKVGDEKAPFTTKLTGDHAPYIIGAAVSLALTCFPKTPLTSLASQLSTATSPRHRLEIHKLTGGRIIIDDCYNSSPAALKTALQLLARTGDAPTVRRQAVLGTMLELGQASKEYHRDAGVLVSKLPISELVTVGDGAYQLGVSAQRGRQDLKWWHVATAREAVALVLESAAEVVLVKGSRGVGLECVVTAMLSADEDITSQRL